MRPPPPPPRRQMTILPVKSASWPASSRQNSSPEAAALTISVGVSSDPVVDLPTRSGRPPASLLRFVRALRLSRLCVEAPTEVSHGASAGEPVVAKPGPSLPFEVATKMPAARAARKPSVSKSSQDADGEEEPIE